MFTRQAVKIAGAAFAAGAGVAYGVYKLQDKKKIIVQDLSEQYQDYEQTSRQSSYEDGPPEPPHVMVQPLLRTQWDWDWDL